MTEFFLIQASIARTSNFVSRPTFTYGIPALTDHRIDGMNGQDCVSGNVFTVTNRHGRLFSTFTDPYPAWVTHDLAETPEGYLDVCPSCRATGRNWLQHTAALP